MNILILSQYFWPEDFRINDVARKLKLLGHNIEVLSGKPNYPGGKFFYGYKAWGYELDDYNGIKVHRIPLISRGKGSINLAINYLSFIFSGIIFAPWYLRKKKFDLIFVYAPSPLLQVIPAILLKYLKNIPIVLWVQDLWPESIVATGYIKSPVFIKLIRILVKFCYANIDTILVQSRAFIKPILSFQLRKNIFYHPNSVESMFYSPANLSAPNIDSLNKGFSVLFAGNVGSAQAMETILSAEEKLLEFKKIKIVILGDGSKIEWLVKEIKTKRLKNIHVEGRYPIETMPILMRKASVLLVSLKNQPIFELTVPNKIQAYLAVGRPIIGSLDGEAAKLIKKARAGLVAPAENDAKLVQAILKVYRMTPKERNQLGQNARAFFQKNFNEDYLANNLVRYFNKTIKKAES